MGGGAERFTDGGAHSCVSSFLRSGGPLDATQASPARYRAEPPRPMPAQLPMWAKVSISGEARAQRIGELGGKLVQFAISR